MKDLEQRCSAENLSRRELLALFAAAGSAAILAACGGAAPAPSAGSAKPSASAGANSASASASAGSSAKPEAGGQWEQVLAAAKREATVTVYAGAGQPNREAMVDPFEKAFPGIKVELTVAPPADLLARIQAERSAGKYLFDVLPSFGTSAIIPLKPVGALGALEPSLLLPEVVDTKAWFEGHLWWLDAEPPLTTLAFVGNAQPMITYNTKVVDPKQFTSYKDLLDPKWKGKIVATDSRKAGPGAVPTRFLYKHPDLGPPFLEQLFGEMNVTLSNDNRQMLDWVAQNQYPIALFISSPEVLLAAKQGLPVALVPGEQFKEGAPMGPGGGTLSVMDKQPHPNAAKVFVNWLLSRDGQTIWQREVGNNSLRIDVPKDDVASVYQLKPGVKYVNAGVEEYAKLSGTVIADLLNRVLEKK